MKVKPSKPAALLTAVFGLGMITFILTSVERDGIVPFFCLAVLGVVGLNLWAAFSKDGSLYSIGDDERPSDDPR